MKKHRCSVVSALLSAALEIFPFTSGAQVMDQSGALIKHDDGEISNAHDFDFFVGRWRVHHMRLKERLVSSHEWIQFEGTTITQTLLGGYGNVDDNEINLPGRAYRVVTLRAYDEKSGEWSIWWLDGRSPRGPLDPPVRGRFKDGVGTFYADDAYNNKPIRVRFIWSRITATSCHWEQAFSPDGGKTWETNWKMDFLREH